MGYLIDLIDRQREEVLLSEVVGNIYDAQKREHAMRLNLDLSRFRTAVRVTADVHRDSQYRPYRVDDTLGAWYVTPCCHAFVTGGPDGFTVCKGCYEQQVDRGPVPAAELGEPV